MAEKKLIAICQSGGDFVTHKDGSLSYNGGDAHAIDIDNDTLFDDFKMEIAEMWNYNPVTMTIKYFLPGNKKTLITISNDKDLKRMINFHEDSITTDVYVITREVIAHDISNMPASRSSRTTISEAVVPVDDTPVDGIIVNSVEAEPLIVDVPMDSTPPPPPPPSTIAATAANIAKHLKAVEWENTITGVDQRFTNVHEFREALRKYSIAHGFAYKFIKNDSHRVTVKCKSEGCPWRLHASRLSTTQLFCIKKMSSTHTCDGAVLTTGNQATTNWVADIIKQKLRDSSVSTSRSITFVADIQKGLRESIAEVFENGYHGYCLRYLTESFKRDLKTQFSNEVKRLLVADFYAAAYAPKLEGFQRSTESIKVISAEAYNWVVASKPEHWANVFFGGARYNHMTSNFGEMFYRWVSEAHELPITQMVDVIRGKMMELIYTRRVDSNQWLTRLTPSMEQKLQKETMKSRSLEVLFSPGSIFEVRGDSIEKVDIDHWDCSCKGWHLTGLPCCHAIAVFECIGRNPYDYCSRYFTTESYRLTYSQSINPVPNIDMPIKKDSSEGTVLVTPPPARRTPGRPKTQRIQDLDKRKLQCSRCKGFGHNKSTCKSI
ncbi:Phox/Bem1p [Macleaya cordata]|uniref:Phox/Bem1p n=1 Tax=Macleaya cordata TaxID=56857 RepID=A0A200R1S0_MACCD|nr:Phox/Bem1p [Macleaya cordata]